jgi:undecaprenyl-diphosphatase
MRAPTRRGALAGARPWGRHATELATGVALVGISWLVLTDATTHRVARWEVHVFESVNDLPDALHWPIWPVMQLGNFWMAVVGGLGVFALTRRWRPALATTTAVLLAWLGAKVVKGIIKRGRPADLLEGVHVRESSLHGHGYVSGHTAIAFAIATVVTPLLPGRWRLLPFTLAGLVGFARIYYGAHLPLDVVGGAGIGILSGLVASLAFGTIDPVHDR